MPNLRYREFVCVATGGTRATQQGPLLGLGPGRKLCSLCSRKGGTGRSLKPTEGHRPCKEAKFLVLEFSTQVFSISRITLECNLET